MGFYVQSAYNPAHADVGYSCRSFCEIGRANRSTSPEHHIFE